MRFVLPYQASDTTFAVRRDEIFGRRRVHLHLGFTRSLTRSLFASLVSRDRPSGAAAVKSNLMDFCSTLPPPSAPVPSCPKCKLSLVRLPTFSLR